MTIFVSILAFIVFAAYALFVGAYFYAPIAIEVSIVNGTENEYYGSYRDDSAMFLVSQGYLFFAGALIVLSLTLPGALSPDLLTITLMTVLSIGTGFTMVYLCNRFIMWVLWPHAKYKSSYSFQLEYVGPPRLSFAS